ncbi:slipin family protein [Kitasatospora sp. NPDC127111]|uniref:slipin family protein n=1 Tax=Kitasatospora sp. NPDC127111 TaxID=3345363 RepID=UPI00362B1055
MVVDVVLGVIVGVLILAAVVGAASVRVVQQFQRGVVFRFGKVRDEVRDPGLVMLVPVADRLRKVNVQIVTMPIPAQEGITRDNVTVRVDAVVYFRVLDPVKATVNVQDYNFAISQVAQTSLRSIIGKSELDDLLANREPINQGLELMIDSPALSWGIEIDRVEIKDVALPESMKRSMSRQAEAERERRARIITADGEYQASARLSEAASVMSATPAALQLRLLQTVVEVAAEKNSTLVLPFPVELLRFLDSAAEAQRQSVRPEEAVTEAGPGAAEPHKLPAVEQLELPPLEELLEHSPLDPPVDGTDRAGSPDEARDGIGEASAEQG